MEKRTIIAFALSFLILLMWSYFFTPKQEPAPPQKAEPLSQEQRQKPDPVKTPEMRPGRAEPAGQTTPIKKAKVSEKEIQVETPLYKAIFTNRGATIKSIRLKNYHLTTDPNSPLIELIDVGESGEDFFQINFEGPAGQNNSEMIYQVNEDSIALGPESQPRDLVFTGTTAGGLSVKKVFRFYQEGYHIDLAFTLSNNTPQQVEGQLKCVLNNLPPSGKKSYYSFVGAALLLDKELEEFDTGDLEEKQLLSGKIGWVAYEDDYFIRAIIPENRSNGTFRGHQLPSGIIAATYLTPTISLKGHEQATSRFTLFLGPRDLNILKNLGKDLDIAINFGFTDILAKPLLYSLRFFYSYVKNYGVAIIILTILVKLIFWLPSRKSYKSMKEMQKLQPHMAKIREKYKDNKEQMNKEIMALYKTYKVNPMGGCWPMLIQMPVFFALFRVLGNSIELRHAPFLLWMNDLSAPDRLFSLPFSIPFMSPPYGIPVLTLFMGASMFIQQKMTPTPGDPAQAKIMLLMPVIFTVMFINFPSGLVLYWLINNCLSIGQQYLIKRSAD
ncbi:membrane protein insertase YidC [Thermodesulfobacteriota bacterium]